MPPIGAVIYTDCDGYENALRDALEVLVLNPNAFRAQLTWLELPGIQLFEAKEKSGRVIQFRAQRERVVVSFPMDRQSTLIAGGNDLSFGSLLLHDGESGFHQRTTGAARWGYIALSVGRFVSVAATQHDREVAHPGGNQIVTPGRAHLRTLLAVHARLTRFVQRHQDLLASPELARAIEEELASAVVKCLVYKSADTSRLRYVDEINLISRLEAAMVASGPQLLTVDAMCRALGVPAKVLRSASARLLGMGPASYQRFRRLLRARKALTQVARRADDPALTIKAQGFANVEAFVSEYWRTFGVLPPLPSRPQPGGR